MKYALPALVLLLAACSEPTIDTSSDETMETSIERVRNNLPESQRADFDSAVTVVAVHDISFGDVLAEGAAGVDVAERKVKMALDGLTAREVIALGDSIIAEREAEMRRQALQEIAELEEKKAAHEQAKEALAAFEVVRSRFYKRTNSIGMPEPIIDITVRNGTPVAVSRAYFEGVLASPSRSVPWIKESFNYSIRGGLEPGEEARWRLAPNMFSEWGQVDAPSDAVFTVETVRIDGPDGEPAFDAREFDEEDAERLQTLREKYPKE
jgi:hypothetical protein